MRFARLLLLTMIFLFLVLSFSLQAQPANSQPQQPAVAEPNAPPEFAFPESYVERVRKQGSVLELSLKDAIRLALVNNLEIAIEDYNEDLSRERVFGTKGFYDPILSLQVGWDSFETPTTSILQAGSGVLTNKFDQLRFVSALQQNVAGGGQFSLSFDNARSHTNSAFAFINPQYGSDFEVSFLQPLWRGFLQTQTERQLKLYNLDTRISDSQFKQRVAEIIQRVQNQYWEMVFAIQNQETRRQSMGLAIVQHDNNKKRLRIGVMAPIEITASRAEVASREQDMIQSEVQIIDAENRLKQLLAPDPQANLWDLSLIPTDHPQMQDLRMTLKDAVRTALERRPELEQIRLQIEQNEVERHYFQKEGKPAVNLLASFGSVGRAGQVFRTQLIDRDGDGVPETPGGRVPDPTNPSFGTLGRAWNQAFGFGFINWGIGLNLQIPLRNRSNEAQLASVAITERQYSSRLKNQQQMILAEVRTAFQTIATQNKRLEAARMARKLSEEQLEGENKRFQAGLSTNFEVLRYQRDLGQAQVQELRALIDYQQALNALQRAMFTIVDDSDIVLAKNR